MNNLSQSILVIDDDKDILDAISITLEYANYKVQTSEKPEFVENLFKGDSALPKMIILDVLLSGKDGRVICKKLKNDKKTNGVPIIMISAKPGVQKSVIEVGADDFLAKPFDMDELLTIVAKYIKV